MADIRLVDVVKRYDNGLVAVAGSSLEIRDGEFLVVVGPSGCGKSTTLRMIAGLESISAGELYIGDQLANGLKPVARDVAMVFQDYALYPHMSVRQNMSFGLRMRKMKPQQIADRVTEAAQMLFIEDLLDRKPSQLSGGQRQRVAVGRAIVRRPAALLMDEPLSNLDAKLRVQLRNDLMRLHQKLKTTTVYVTHDQAEAMALADRMVVMRSGEIQQIDGPLELYNRPVNRFVAGFIGSPSMNFLPGQIRDGCFTSESIRYPLEPSELVEKSNTSATLGFRPEALELAGDGRPATFECSVELVEAQGHQTFIHSRIDGAPVVVRVPVDGSYDVGQVLRFRLPHDRWYLFEDTSEGRLLACGA